MESALAWVGQIAEWIGQFIPRRLILPVNMGGVKYVRGAKVVKLGPGIHFYWPLLTSLELYPTATQTDDLPTQTMETLDKVPFIVGGMVTYSVDDVSLLLPKTHAPDKQIQASTLAAIHFVCCRMTWEQLHAEQTKGTLDTKLRHAAQKPLVQYGVKIEDCQLTDLAKTKVYRLINSTQQDAK